MLDALVTQNIDGLHQAAGLDPAKVVEIHGTIREVVCLGCGARGPIEPTLERVRAGEDDPACLELRRHVEVGDDLVRPEPRRRRSRPGLRRGRERATCCWRSGSTSSVYPVAAMVPTASRAGARIVIVNAEPTDMDDLADVVVRGSISEVLPDQMRRG